MGIINGIPETVKTGEVVQMPYSGDPDYGGKRRAFIHTINERNVAQTSALKWVYIPCPIPEPEPEPELDPTPEPEPEPIKKKKRKKAAAEVPEAVEGETLEFAAADTAGLETESYLPETTEITEIPEEGKVPIEPIGWWELIWDVAPKHAGGVTAWISLETPGKTVWRSAESEISITNGGAQ
jgi:hypothetical protein